MFNKLRSWLLARREQRLWELQERQLAFRLLGEYRAVRVQIDDLTLQDKQNIASLLKMPEYASLKKLHDNLKANQIRLMAMKKLTEEDMNAKRGAVMILELVDQAVIDANRIIQNKQNEEQQDVKLASLLGWK